VPSHTEVTNSVYVSNGSPKAVTACIRKIRKRFLSTADIHTLFRDVHQKWIEGGNYELCIEDVQDEIWDMVKPTDHTFRFASIQTRWNHWQ
nr:probable serine/threonine-protein phosphatase 2A regulatory subunit B'' subunit TON2 [Tanacetum cinerariifolium]